jgi:hypothetical protein
MQYFNINNIVKFKFEGPEKFCNSFRYLNYNSDAIKEDDLDFIVNVGPFKPDLENCSIFDHNYYIKEGYLYVKEDSYKLLKWKIQIKNFHEKPFIINICSKSSPIFNKIFYIVIEQWIVDSFINFVLVNKGISLIHASSILKNDQAILFAGRSGAGKTTISTQMMKNNYQFISDNYSIITSKQIVFGFIEPLNIFSYNLNIDVRKAMSRYQIFILQLKNILYKISQGYIKIFTPINPSSIFEIGKEGNLKAIYLIIPQNHENDDIKLQQISKDLMIGHLMYNQKLEFPFFNKYLSAYSYVYPGNSLVYFWENYVGNLGESLNNCNYLMHIPTKLDENILMEIVEEIIR